MFARAYVWQRKRRRLAEHFRHIKYTQLNSDVFTRVVDFEWHQMVEEYEQSKRVEGLVDASIYEVLLTLRHFQRVVGINSSKEITQPNLDAFVLKRSEEVGKNTLNKDIRNLSAFLNWAVKNRFVAQLTNDVYTNVDPVLRPAVDLLPVAEWL